MVASTVQKNGTRPVLGGFALQFFGNRAVGFVLAVQLGGGTCVIGPM
jgi:hypothetical protein